MKTLGDTLPRRFKAKASGSITGGKPLIVKSDGDVTQISATGGGPSVGPLFEADYPIAYNGPHAVYDTGNDKVVMAGGDIDSGRLAVFVGTVSGETITFGSKQEAGDDPLVENVALTFDPDSGKVIMAYRDRSNSNYATARVITVSGSTASIGTATVFLSAAGSDKQMTYDTNANKVVIAVRNNSQSGNGYGYVGTVSGTNISFGSGTAFTSTGTCDNIGVTFDSSNNKVVVVYQDNAASHGLSVVGTVSGTSISFGTPVTINAASTSELCCSFDATNNKVVVFYKDGGNSGYGTAIVGTVSGTSISYGTEVVFESNSVVLAAGFQSSVFDPDNSLITISYSFTGGGGCFKAGTVSGTSITFGDKLVFEPGDIYYPESCYDPDTDRVVTVYVDAGRSNYFTAAVIKTVGSNLTSENYIGIAEYAAADTETATVLIKGGVSTTQSSLTPGQTYFVQGDGTLGLAADDPSVTAGTAVTSTKLIVKG